MAKPKADLLEVVEAGYQVDASDEEWVALLAEKARPHLDEGFGIAAFEYYLPPGKLPRMLQSYHLGIPKDLEAMYGRIFDSMPDEIRMRPFRMGPCIAGSQMMGKRAKEFLEEPYMKQFAHKFGVYDSFWITAMEPGGRGCGFHASRPTVGWATQSQMQRWGRVAGHLST